MKNLYKKELKEYASKFDETNSFQTDANFKGFEHSMIIGDDLEKVYQDLTDFEKAELTDFFNLERNGRTNKKR